MTRRGMGPAIAAVSGIVLTVVVAAVPSVYFAYRTPHVRVVLETSEALVGILVAFLCLGRYRRRRHFGDLAIVLAMGLLAIDYPILNALPRALSGTAGESLGKWASLAAWLLAAGSLALASMLALSWRHDPTTSRLRWAALAIAPAAVAAVVTLVWTRDWDSLLTPELSERPSPLADPIVTGLQLGASGLFALAAARFSNAARIRGDRFVGWLGTGCMLGAVASLDYALFPALNPDWLHIGELFETGVVVAWSLSAVEEMHVYWLEVSRLAHADERRRLARDLHDGLAQELAFLVSHSQAPASARSSPDWLARLRAAAERGLAESRRAILALSADASPPLNQDLGRTAADIAGGAGAAIDLDVNDALFEPGQQETVVRIVREAVTNATRHGGATRIRIQFTNHSRPLLRICDNGVGFDPAASNGASGGFGLLSMRERAETLGATLAVRSAPGQGTTVEVAWH